MRVIVTGAAGFIGTSVVRALIEQGGLADTAGSRQPLSELVLLDIVEPAIPATAGSITIDSRRGDICDEALRRELFSRPVDAVVHLAATLTAEAQADPSKGTQVNVRGMLDLLEACRGQPRPPRFIFASSIATYGGSLPEVVDDDVVQRPQTSYGSHKVIAEQLINDHSRHGIIDGRALRLPIVLVRPPSTSPSVSDQVAAIVREPLAGRDSVCPFRPDTRLTVASVQRTARALIQVAELPADAFGATRAMNLPALTTTPSEMVASVARTAPDKATGTVTFDPDPAAQAVVDGWPAHFVSERAAELGLTPEDSFDRIVEAYLDAR